MTKRRYRSKNIKDSYKNKITRELEKKCFPVKWIIYTHTKVPFTLSITNLTLVVEKKSSLTSDCQFESIF